MMDVAETIVIPDSESVRHALCRTVRETDRLKKLLKLALQAEEDRRFLATQGAKMATRRQPTPSSTQGVAR